VTEIPVEFKYIAGKAAPVGPRPREAPQYGPLPDRVSPRSSARCSLGLLWGILERGENQMEGFGKTAALDPIIHSSSSRAPRN